MARQERSWREVQFSLPSLQQMLQAVLSSWLADITLTALYQALWAYVQEVVSAEEFHKLVQQLSNEERNNGKDFLHLVQYGARDMVFVTEG